MCDRPSSCGSCSTISPAQPTARTVGRPCASFVESEVSVWIPIVRYRSMLEDHGWAEQKWRAWVIETLSEALFERSAGR